MIILKLYFSALFWSIAVKLLKLAEKLIRAIPIEATPPPAPKKTSRSKTPKLT